MAKRGAKAAAAVTAATTGGISLRSLRTLLGSRGLAPALPGASDPLWAWLEGKITTRKGATPQVDVLANPATPHAWLLVVANDQPFLTDTVGLAVRRHGLDMLALWHPVVNVERERGKLRHATPATAGGRKPREAWILLQVGALDAAGAVALAEDVRHSLALAVAAVRDFAQMQARMAGLIGNSPAGEARAFLQWVANGNMILLGYRHYDYRQGKAGLTVQATPDSGLGILAETDSAVRDAKAVAHTGTSLGLYVQGNDWLVLSKTPDVSRVHRAAAMDYVAVLERNAKGLVVAEHRFIGLYTSSAYTTRVQDVPLVRERIAAVIKDIDWPRDSHNARSLTNILETWPRDELFLSDAATLARMATATVAVRERPDVCVLVRTSEREQAASVLVYLPIGRMSTRVREAIAALLADKLGRSVREFKVEMGEGELARLYFKLPWSAGMPVDEAALTHDVRMLVRGWDDELQEALMAQLGSAAGLKRWRAFAPDADAGYRAATPVAVALDDLRVIDSDVPLHMRTDTRGGMLHLRLLRKGQGWTLAELMPLVESCGLAAVSEQTFIVGNHWVHDIVCVMPEHGVNPQQNVALVAVMTACLEKILEENSLNQLALGAALGVREVAVWRAWVAYLQQLDRRFDPRTVRIAVRNRPDLARMLWELFDARHNPETSPRKRAVLAKPLIAALEQDIVAMPTAELERIWRSLLSVVLATVRTNAWQPRVRSQEEALALKLDCSKITGMVEPRPWREIFVYHPSVEGVHLRGGPVARGGLRHSDRATDYRTEVLALMTAQMRKNTIIVPVGAKGGFLVRQATATVKECYQRYIRALLSVTDTYDTASAERRVVAPVDVVRHDGDDAYLVVAADKGTARFSDTANAEAIAADYWPGVKGGFWLGDAFASGGSKGYDHKDMAITAKGAWVSVAHHLAALNLTPSAERPVTVVGVGDMSGDVFGNGLLRDRHVQLVGAFNHLHIFLDPEPDPAVSFAERQRLFDAGLGWDGYDIAKISAGGGVFKRNDKLIPLSPRVQARLGIKAKALPPEQVIQALLRAPVDVLWNGGIGTYIKATDEPDSAAADKANDDVRVDAGTVHAKVIGEGGNLGITPRGRVELARKGIWLNTDALDNSAGVDTSDHEVNVKILLQLALRRKKLDEAGRVALLRSMTDEISTLVLRDNAQQNLAVTLDAEEGDAYHHELHRWQGELVDMHIVDLVVDCLPSLRSLGLRKPARYTRPELAALLAGTKAWLRAELLRDTDLLDNPALQRLLVHYFPTALQAKFGDLIPEHPLAREITATVLANLTINRLGILAVPQLMRDFDASTSDAMRALTVAVLVGGMGTLWGQLDALPHLPHTSIVAVSERLKLVTRVVAAWVLRHGQPVDVTQWINTLQQPCAEILTLLPKALHGRPELAKWSEEWETMGLPAPMARRMTLLSPFVIAPDVALLSAKLKKPLAEVLAVHLKLGEMLKLPALVKKVRDMPMADAWTRQAVQTMGQDLFTRQARLSEKLLTEKLGIDTWLSEHDGGYKRYLGLVKDVVHERQLTSAMLSVLLGRLRELEN